jgi:ABC-type phosphate transport system substrate-binding protein
MWTKAAGIFLVLIGSLAAAGTAVAQVTVVAYAAAPLDSLEKGQLLKYFTGDTEYWPDDVPIVIVDLAAKGPIRDSFYAFLGKTSSRMRSIWLKRKLTGEGELPESIASEEELISKVASTAGAIGFVSAEIARAHPEVKILIGNIPLAEDH